MERKGEDVSPECTGGGGGVRRDAGSPRRRAQVEGALFRCGAECSPTRKGRTLHARVLGTTLHQGAQTGGKELIPQAL